jgi:hypothetical protein
MKKRSNGNQMGSNRNTEEGDVEFTQMMLETIFSMGVTHEYILMELIVMIMKEKMTASVTLERDCEVWLRGLRSKVLEQANKHRPPPGTYSPNVHLGAARIFSKLLSRYAGKVHSVESLLRESVTH